MNWNTDNLQFTEREKRLSHNPNTPGKEKGDHAGHLVADRFGGSPELDNLVTQSADVNLKKYKKLENLWAKALESKKVVKINVDITYDRDRARPISFHVKYCIDNDWHSELILNWFNGGK